MKNKGFVDGFIILGTGLLASSVSSFCETFALLGSTTGFVRGLFDGLAVVAFCAAIVVLVRSRNTGEE